MEEFLDEDPKHWKCALQKSACEVTGEVFVRPITGRFKDIPEERVQQKVEEIRLIFKNAGHPLSLNPCQPLWIQAEYLENILDFELNPPCGCSSDIRGE